MIRDWFYLYLGQWRTRPGVGAFTGLVLLPPCLFPLPAPLLALFREYAPDLELLATFRQPSESNTNLLIIVSPKIEVFSNLNSIRPRYDGEFFGIRGGEKSSRWPSPPLTPPKRTVFSLSPAQSDQLSHLTNIKLFVDLNQSVSQSVYNFIFSCPRLLTLTWLLIWGCELWGSFLYLDTFSCWKW